LRGDDDEAAMMLSISSILLRTLILAVCVWMINKRSDKSVNILFAGLLINQLRKLPYVDVNY
jgi:hypothetical protein